MRSDVIAVTTQAVPGYRVVKVYGVVHGLTARTRGLGGKIVGSLQSIVGGEVSAFTKEIDKAKDEGLKASDRTGQRNRCQRSSRG